jgi:hypothetical protein
MEEFKTIAQIIYYVAMSIAGPLAVIAYLKSKKEDRLAKEYKTYDQLDNKFFEYQKLALEYYDLDILDVPNNDPSLAFDKKRKQEMVAYAILFSLFERAYLMFGNQADTFRQHQWSGWKHFLNDFLRRESVRKAWEISKQTYDTDFQKFMDKKIAAVLAKPSSDLARAISLNLPHLEIDKPETAPARSALSPNGKLEVPPPAALALSAKLPHGKLGTAGDNAAGKPSD